MWRTKTSHPTHAKCGQDGETMEGERERTSWASTAGGTGGLDRERTVWCSNSKTAPRRFRPALLPTGPSARLKGGSAQVFWMEVVEVTQVTCVF